MSDLDRRLRARIDEFVRDISELVRRAALEAVSEALGASEQPKRGRRRATRPASKPKNGGKRSAKELESLAHRIESFVAENPGSGASAIARALELGTKDLVLPMKKLVASGALSSKGRKRATKYFRGKGR